jgi:hypothetical protein
LKVFEDKVQQYGGDSGFMLFAEMGHTRWIEKFGVKRRLVRWIFGNPLIAITPNYFFTPRTVSFATLATRNLSTVLAGILIFCCVLGLKPVRAFLFCLTSLPKPGRTNSPVFLIVL